MIRRKEKGITVWWGKKKKRKLGSEVAQKNIANIREVKKKVECGNTRDGGEDWGDYDGGR